MSTQKQQRFQAGFAALEIILTIVLLLAIAFGGYLVWSRSKAKEAVTNSQATTSSSSATPSTVEPVASVEVPTAPTVSDTKDLDAAAKALDDTNVDAGTQDSAELESDLSSF